MFAVLLSAVINNSSRKKTTTLTFVPREKMGRKLRQSLCSCFTCSTRETVFAVRKHQEPPHGYPGLRKRKQYRQGSRGNMSGKTYFQLRVVVEKRRRLFFFVCFYVILPHVGDQKSGSDRGIISAPHPPNTTTTPRSASHPTTASSDTQTGWNTFARERCIDRKRVGQKRGKR
jgi:hypothetical protein